ncbi:hypothetical protein BGZ61DRAFT_453545 [Ilyonectria robusta]|uniref:uncharacterized protein n=1 Tax=Ilyonectria robusta TaxID=1079257 RepID=UPI001E8E48BA|nr:uncharacterized protein BGZ61DRAFT_453545 [Ilyonectria robusta]KAH8686734.1 hypothetical protein BGZ61DRAFT_453545 [Ilyonectria robusta]
MGWLASLDGCPHPHPHERPQIEPASLPFTSLHFTSLPFSACFVSPCAKACSQSKLRTAHDEAATKTPWPARAHCLVVPLEARCEQGILEQGSSTWTPEAGIRRIENLGRNQPPQVVLFV